MRCKIYSLEHPITGEVRYIGKTEQSLSIRLAKHIYESKKNKTHKNNWIQNLIKQELKPVISLIEEITFNDWEFYEKYWIAQFKAWGFDLVNLTEGGESVYRKGETFEQKYGKEKSEDIKRRCRESQKNLYKNGYINPMKGKVGKLNPLYAKKRSKEAINNFILANKGRVNTIEAKRNISAGKLGNRVIREYTKNGTLIKEFTNIYDIVSLYGFRRQSILDNLCRKRKSYKGRIFTYKNKT